VSLGPGNVLAGLESEVGVLMPPAEFAAKASITISAAQARGILSQLGIQVPSIIRDIPALDYELKIAPRLTPEQIQEFLLKVGNLKD
jgi:hypothetical protein